MQKIFQQFLSISRILAGIFSAANSSSKFGWYPANANFLRRIFVGKYNFGGYGEFLAAWGSICKSDYYCHYYYLNEPVTWDEDSLLSALLDAASRQ